MKTFLVVSLLIIACEAFNETYRPQFHFTPARGWMNDPNGLVYVKEQDGTGWYHLFYQYNTLGEKSPGNIGWGHAKSQDLVHWDRLPQALFPGEKFYIFSGSAVQIEGTDTVCLLYTGMNDVTKIQNQNLAFSPDGGEKFLEFTKNPVIDLKKTEFRDPKIFSYKTEDGRSYYVMAVVLPDVFTVQFYKSTDFIAWELLSEFTMDTKAIWECPDLFEMSVGPNKKWVLTFSLQSKEVSKTVYYVGDFDGTKFTLDPSFSTQPVPIDHGSDFYAAVTYENEPQQRRIMIGWLGNWEYSTTSPTDPWRCSQSIPRMLELKNIDNQYKLYSTPIPELTKLRKTSWTFSGKPVISAGSPTVVSFPKDIDTRHCEIELELQIPISSRPPDKVGIQVLRNEAGEENTLIYYDIKTKNVVVDRSKSGNVKFSDRFLSVVSEQNVPLREIIKFHIFVDASSVEVFVNDGEAVLSSILFPNQKSTTMSVICDGQAATFTIVKKFVVHPLTSIWE
ncbi:beta-fructofuranosidase [Acrasis kona]|uniref:Beta-fructofuranosidase n=1 Tax=Acrasis kona TaxID=1008807 RepID=A0AAW2ZB61_9EUKA